MNKFFKYLRILIVIALTVFISIFMFKTLRCIKKIEEYNISYQIISLCICFIIYIALNIKDLIKRDKINNNTRYNILSCVALLIISLLFIRALYDPSFLANVKNYRIGRVVNTGKIYYNYFFQYNIMYIESNVIYIDLLLILLILYRYVNKKSTK